MLKKPTLSIIVPIHNERSTVSRTLSTLLNLSIPCHYEIIAVDDGSTDDTPVLLSRFNHPNLLLLQHVTNRGKGAAVLTGLSVATGTHVLVFDADSEYDPRDIGALIDPLIRERADVVYGVRRFGDHTSYASLRYAIGNVAMTLFANVLFGSVLTDLHTCLKLVPTRLLREFNLTETGFGLDTEITAELLRHSIRPFEVPVSYVARSRSQGKQIGWRDGVRCLEILLRVRLRGVTPMPSTIDLRDRVSIGSSSADDSISSLPSVS